MLVQQCRPTANRCRQTCNRQCRRQLREPQFCYWILLFHYWTLALYQYCPCCCWTLLYWTALFLYWTPAAVHDCTEPLLDPVILDSTVPPLYLIHCHITGPCCTGLHCSTTGSLGRTVCHWLEQLCRDDISTESAHSDRRHDFSCVALGLHVLANVTWRSDCVYSVYNVMMNEGVA